MPSVTYNGNGNTGGTVPVDNTAYNNGDTVTVLGNTGSLVKNSDTFAYWNTAADGSGTFYGPTATFSIGAGNITLFAMWYTTAGLINGGTTTHYQFAYDRVLATAVFGNIEPARTNSLLANAANSIPVVENDFAWMQTQFAGVNVANQVTVPIPTFVNAGTGGGYGAGWWPLGLNAKTNPATCLRSLIVAEVVEMFMAAQDKGWGYSSGVGNEESSGEALSLFLAVQFQLNNSLGTNWLFNGTPAVWLNTSLPTGNPASTEFDGTTHYGSRQDYVNSTLPFAGNGPGTGCSMAFIYYLFAQLGFSSIPQIIDAAPGVDVNNNLIGPSCLRGVWQNLTSDNGDPFPLFKALLDNAFPQSAVASIPGPNPDNPFPLALLSFWVDKSTFGRDEVQDVINTNGGRFENAFFLVLEGFNKNTYLSLAPAISVFSGSFTAITGIQIVPNAVPVTYENSDPRIPQRIRLGYDIIFTENSLNDVTAFPAVGGNAIQKELDTSVTIDGNVITASNASTIFEMVAGADPYFTNINAAQGNVFWLSQDLRVMTVTPGIDNSPFGSVAAGKPALTPVDNTSLDTAAAFQYAQNLITYLNNNYSDPNQTDPFTLLPDNGVAFSDASSVAEYTLDNSNPFLPRTYQNYCFAMARVRLRGVVGSSSPANNVKVFFRLWKSQTPDTNFGNNNYPSQTDVSGSLISPLAPADNNTIPMYASGNYGSNNDYGGSTINNRTLQITTRDYVWAYYVCYLNLYDSTNVYNNNESVVSGWPVGTHHCVVAQIAYDGAPIINTTIIKNPENCDKLAQRNLQLTYSDNPGVAATHRIPQTFDTVPSSPLLNIPGSLLNEPDELMIDWGAIPEGSTANIYWPQVNSSEVLDLANGLYGSHLLMATDSHTIQCKTTKGATYIPVPVGSGENFAGLFTVDLPPTIVAGQEYNIVVRKISTHGARIKTEKFFAKGEAFATRVTSSDIADEFILPDPSASMRIQKPFKNWRYVAGTFQVRIPVTTKDTILAPEENTLAIMKARLQAMSPANRWYPVLQRYILYISARVDGLGGDSSSIKPSFQGMLPPIQTEGEECQPSFKDKCCKIVIYILSAMTFVLFIILILLLILLLKK